MNEVSQFFLDNNHRPAKQERTVITFGISRKEKADISEVCEELGINLSELYRAATRRIYSVLADQYTRKH